MTKVDFVPATQSLAEEYFAGGRPPYGFRGYAALLDGEVVGLGGVYWSHGAPVLFSQAKNPLRRDRKACARGARLLQSYLDTIPFEVYAVASPAEPTSQQLLARLGFEYAGVETREGPLMVHRRIG